MRLLLIALLMLGCEGYKQSFAGKIIKIHTNGSITSVTLDTLAKKDKSFGAIGHGEVWIFNANLEQLNNLLGRQVIIRGICDGWTCQNTTIQLNENTL